MTLGTVLFAFVMAVVFAILTDYGMFKWEQEKAVEKSWQELNDKLEKTGRERLDKKKK